LETASARAEKPVMHDVKKCSGELADEELFAQFVRGDVDDVAANDAFKALVERHAPMVLGICRLILDHAADGEDAFQATFLILARKGATIRNRAVLAAWLHEIAYRTAAKARDTIARRRFLERQSASMLPSPFVPDRQHDDVAWQELRPVLHDEIRRLPEKYRVPVILSYLEAKTNEEVAQILHWPVGTVNGRLSRARTLLKSRLVRRGMTLSAAFLFTALADGAVFAEVVPPELIERTILFVQEFDPRSASSDTSSELARPFIETSVPKRLGVAIDTLRKHLRFIHLPSVVSIKKSVTGTSASRHC
jgi:RNA polymerase sigma factor (sigma-70 family)